MLRNNVEGYLYQADAPYMLSYYIEGVFEAKERAKEYGLNISISDLPVAIAGEEVFEGVL